MESLETVWEAILLTTSKDLEVPGLTRVGVHGLQIRILYIPFTSIAETQITVPLVILLITFLALGPFNASKI